MNHNHTTRERPLLVPRPRQPLADALRRFLGPEPSGRSVADLDELCANLREVAVWTSSRGSWQENASFVLRTADGSRHLIGFGDPMAGELISRLRRLPGFSADRLLDLIGSHSELVTPLWPS